MKIYQTIRINSSNEPNVPGYSFGFVNTPAWKFHVALPGENWEQLEQDAKDAIYPDELYDLLEESPYEWSASSQYLAKPETAEETARLEAMRHPSSLTPACVGGYYYLQSYSECLTAKGITV